MDCHLPQYILEYTPRGGGAPLKKLELAFRNEPTQKTWAFIIDVGKVDLLTQFTLKHQKTFGVSNKR